MLNVIYPFSTTFLDYPNNEDQAILVFIMGCDNYCKGCQNIQFKDPYYNDGEKFPSFKIISELEKLSCRINSRKVVLSGGDPLSKNNVEFTKYILQSDFDFMIYTGHDIEYVKENKVNGFKFIKCGNYLDQFKQTSEKTDDYIKFASSNQELYNNKYEKLSENGVYYFKGDE